MVKHPPKCPKCHTRMVMDHGVYKCLNDSEEITSIAARHQFFEENKQAIINLYQEKGHTALMEAYGITSSTWFALRVRWGVPLRARRQSPATPSRNGAMPELPAFSNDWSPEVQIKWLEV